MTAMKRKRRTQEERTIETRTALIEASVRVIERLGYGGASTALIADDAGVSRGAILYHFGTRAQLMADVVSWVYEIELGEYVRLEESKNIGNRLSDWPELLWEVLSRPSGIAVLEILQATRSDPELAAHVLPMQQRVEERSLHGTMARFGADRETTLAAMRLMVWAARGLSIERVLIKDPTEVQSPIRLLQMLFERVAPSGRFENGFTLHES